MTVDPNNLRQSRTGIDIAPDYFRQIGHQLVDQIADLLTSLPGRPVTRGLTPPDMAAKVRSHDPLPNHGSDPGPIVADTANLLIENSLYNSHPRFWGYITAPAAPIGILGDMLAAAVNPNLGSWTLSPVGTEIESQAVRWIAELLGYPADCGGLMVSGGNMANFVGFLAARAHMAKTDVNYDLRKHGLKHREAPRFTVYVSTETHTWIQKAADMYGLGTDAIRWIDVDSQR
ncbi:aspartate aminotransferase family protein, partial [candidate division GN15 bacterium]|nr:aspartate aminotransferase family protein [candidate division GN15 bacterium]